MAYWYLAPSLVQLRREIDLEYPARDKTTDGAIGDAAHNARKSDHNADWDSTPPGIIRAIDVDEDLYGPSTTDKGAVSQALVDRIITDPRVAYVIYERRIWQNPAAFRQGGWRPYTAAGKSGWFNPHKMHFHVSIRHGIQWERDTSPWLTQEDDMTPQLADRLQQIVEWLDKRVDQLAAHTDRTIRTELDKRLARDRRRAAFASAVENGAVALDPDGPYYVVEWDGSLTPVSTPSWANFRRTPRGAKLVVEVLPPDQHDDARKRMNAPGSTI